MSNTLNSLQYIGRTIAILVALSATAAIGLAAVNPAVPAADSRTPSTDAGANRTPSIAAPAAPPAATETRDSGLDPWLQQINHGGAHHG